MKQGYGQPALNLHLTRSLRDNEITELNDLIQRFLQLPFFLVGQMSGYDMGEKRVLHSLVFLQAHFNWSMVVSFPIYSHLEDQGTSWSSGFHVEAFWGGLNTMDRFQRRNLTLLCHLPSIPCVCYRCWFCRPSAPSLHAGAIDLE